MSIAEALNIQTADNDIVSTQRCSTKCRDNEQRLGNFKPKTLSAHSRIIIDAAPSIFSVIGSSNSSSYTKKQKKDIKSFIYF